MERKKTQRFHHIDMMRFILSVIIVYYHILHSNIMPYVGENGQYEALAPLCNNAANIVAVFFIIGGMFLYQSFCSKPGVSIFQYTVSRIVRLLPVLLFSILAESAFFTKVDWYHNLINAFLLQCSGLSLEYKGILWYVSSFFWASIFLYALLSCMSKKKALLLIAVLTYFTFVFRINYLNGSIGGRETVYYTLNLGVMTAIGDMGVGILIAEVSGRLHHMGQLCPPGKLASSVIRVLLAAVEIASIIFLFRYFLFPTGVKNHIIVIIVSSILLLSMLSPYSLTGALFNHKAFGYPGRYAYSIYVMQQTSFYILRKLLWPHARLMTNTVLALSVSVLFSVFLGCVIYYLVERPCIKLYGKWSSRYKAAAAANAKN